MTGLLLFESAGAFPPPALAAELSEIQERGYLIVAVKDNTRPLGFRDQQGALVGLEIDIARQLATQLFGQPDALVLVPISNSERIPTLLEDEVDLVIARLGMTDARSRIVDFSDPYYLDGTALITRRPDIQRLADLSGQTVAVLNHSTTIDIVRSLLPNVTLVGASSYQDALALLESGQADAFAADATVLTGWVQQHSTYRLLPTLLSAEALAIAMPRGLQYEELRQFVNQEVQQWNEGGWLQERIHYWGLP